LFFIVNFRINDAEFELPVIKEGFQLAGRMFGPQSTGEPMIDRSPEEKQIAPARAVTCP
jgi:hypothetical protein